MADNENVIETPAKESVVEVEDTSPVVEAAAKPESGNGSNGEKFLAGIKEWFRKFIVGLKHKTHRIPFVLLVITSFVYLCFLGTLSQFIEPNSGIKSLGIFMFVNTLASILVLMLFLYSFPNRKKTNLVFLSITFAVLTLMLIMDILFYVNILSYASKNNLDLGLDLDAYSVINCVIVHIVMLVICIIALATLPLYKKLICKINTSKEVKSSTMSEALDTSEEDG